MASSKRQATSARHANVRTTPRDGPIAPPRARRCAARTRRLPAKTEARHGETFTTPDGRRLFFARSRPDDAEALRRGFARLTPEQARLRTFHRIAELSPESRRAADAHRSRHDDGAMSPSTTTARSAATRASRRSAHRFGRVRRSRSIRRTRIKASGWRLMQRLVEDAKRRGAASFGAMCSPRTTRCSISRRGWGRSGSRSRTSPASCASRFACGADRFHSCACANACERRSGAREGEPKCPRPKL